MKNPVETTRRLEQRLRDGNQPGWPKGKVIPKWLTTTELGILKGQKPDTVKHQITQGMYKKVRKVSGRGGLVWNISIYDEAIPGEIRELYKRQFEAGTIPHSTEDIASIKASLVEILRLLRKTAGPLVSPARSRTRRK